ncbi:unnamed protein product (macronuclear) [Paramecium tetraurelia]|uniref:Chromosome undetermined scaffold_1, whole genome shotgun sequence n=1 Tax=Paramecium tetraurelia TaxID=5888 RepID=Q6BGB3_PARTE|nr:hypothetical protein [Paramecium tetraurelia strain d4-2]XP_001423394.1 uncharacterized protein GSPATT00000431001 [Paramecium tetraurelia]CAH03307.1 hypothetical protein PTMB.109c [Paramecium tetraurelia]CAK55996.1 unnamed protein product [Paramecium tetraurelia]|eukprot:XP_001423394.1 hypothetical protein (macronuclear) [Paramecium tetraurelia strain d4-2]
MRQNKLNKQSPSLNTKQKQYIEQISYNCILEKIKFIQIGINEAIRNNNLTLIQQHLNQYQSDLQSILDFLVQNEYTKVIKDLEQMKEQKKQLSVKLEALELQNLLRDKDPEYLATQVQSLIEQNKKLSEKVQKFKLIAEQAQEQALESLEISNLNQALFQQIKYDSDQPKQSNHACSNSNGNLEVVQLQLDEKIQEIEMLKLQLDELAQLQQKQYNDYQEELEHQKMWINQLSNKVQLYESQADQQRNRYEEKIMELENKIQQYESFDENQTQELLQSLVDQK